MNSACLFPNEARLEKHLWTAETLIANSNNVAVWELVGLLLVRALTRSLHLTVKVNGNVAKLFLHITHNLALCSGGEGIATLRKDLHHVFSQIAPCQIEAEDRYIHGWHIERLKHDLCHP